MSDRVNVVLLAAGYGTRLYPLTKDTPKALLPIASRPMLDWILDAVRTVPRLGQIALVTNARFADQFEAWRGGAAAPVEVVNDATTTNETRLGAIRDLLLASSRFRQAGDWLVLGTDNLFTWPLAELVAFAQRQRPRATIGAWELPSLDEARQFGILSIDANGRILQFLEKPKQPPSKLAALAVYYFPVPAQPRLEQFLTQGGNPDAPGFFIEWLVKQEPVFAYKAGGEWFDIGSVASYEQANRRWMELRPTPQGRGSGT